MTIALPKLSVEELNGEFLIAVNENPPWPLDITKRAAFNLIEFPDVDIALLYLQWNDGTATHRMALSTENALQDPADKQNNKLWRLLDSRVTVGPAIKKVILGLAQEHAKET